MAKWTHGRLAAVLGAALALTATGAPVDRLGGEVARAAALEPAAQAPTDQELFRARVLTEPFVPTGPTTPEENGALAAAIRSYTAGSPNDPTPFVRFLRAYPESAWRASLLANLGVIYARMGYFTRAVEAWTDAWDRAKDAQAGNVRAIADFAMGESLALGARMGNLPMIEAHLRLIGGRTLRGPAETKAALAQQTLGHIRRYPASVISSGARALQEVLKANDPEAVIPETIARYTPTAAGMSLRELTEMAEQAGVRATSAKWAAGAEPPVPSIVHLRFGHFSAIVAGNAEGRKYLVRDPALGGDLWISSEALREEASGFFLVPSQVLAAGWTTVSAEDASAVVGRSCPEGPPDTDAPCPTCGGAGGPAGGPAGGGSGDSGSGGGGCTGGSCAKGLAVYSLNAIDASLLIRDTPLFYSPPRGPEVRFALTYKSRETVMPQILAFGNLGYRWTFDWLSYAEEWTESSIAGSVRLFLRGGGEEWHIGPPDGTGAYGRTFRGRAGLVRTSLEPLRYERSLSDGSVEVFALPDGAPRHLRRVFMTEAIDPRGQRLQFGYDSQLRLVSVTDAIGQVTTLSYELPSDPLKITRVTDPFGRSAVLAYNDAGQLISITDVGALISSVTYVAGDYIGALTTPYGTTTFRHETRMSLDYWEPSIEATDPLGGTERLEFRWETADLPVTEPSAVVPAGFALANDRLNKYNTLYWDKSAWRRAPGDLSQATLTHWLLNVKVPDGSGQAFSDPTPHSIKRPLENRVWYRYPGQTETPSGMMNRGTHNTASHTARVLDDGTTQLSQATYNDPGNVTSRSGPLGRQTTYVYATNGIDLLEVRQTSPGVNDLLASYANYTAQHQPQSVTDAAGQTTTFTYNAAGQVLAVTTPPRAGITENRTTEYVYDANGRLQSVTRPAPGATTAYTYDSFGRMRTITDEDSYTITTDYDALNRPTRVTYPDGTYEETTYQRLDAVLRRDRLGRQTRYTYDALGRLVATRDPAGRTIGQQWDGGALARLIDANGHATRWERNAAGRLAREIRADGLTSTQYTYDLAGRLKTVTDPKQQVTTYIYNPDDTLASTVYTNAHVATPSVSFMYDAAYSRVATMVDGTGTTVYAYHPAGSLGAGQVASVDGPLADDTITYAYDELGRVVSRAINGVAAAQQYDALGRVTTETNVLGTFTYGYDGVTGRLAAVAYPNGQTSTYSYLPNLQDHRLETIHHKYPSGSTLSKFDYTYDGAGNILTWRQQADTTAVVWEYGYDAADQLTAAIKKATDPQQTVLKRYYYRYDPAGNRLSEQIDDSITSWTYDSLNRLVTQTPGGLLKIRGQLDEPGTVSVNGAPALVSAANLFEGVANVTAGTTAFTITAADLTGNTATQQYEVDTAGAAKVFTFDANGNMTSDGTRTFEWDARNQLLAFTNAAHRSEFTYDALQQTVRILEKESGDVQLDRRLVWCDSAVCEERDPTGMTVVRRPFAFGEHTTGAYFFVTDHLGRVRHAANVLGGTEGRYDFEPWGRRAAAPGTYLTESGAPGHRWHADSGLWLTLFRAYSPEVGNWLTEDPAGTPDGPNRYLRVLNNPLRFTDSFGLYSCSCNDPCPSRRWKVSTITADFGLPGLVLSGGFGWISCDGRPTIGRSARVFCATWGLVYGVGISAYVQLAGASHSGPCRPEDLKEFRATGYLGFYKYGSLGDTGAGGAVSSSRAGIGRVECRVVPL